VDLADPPLGPGTEAFFGRVLQFMQDVGTPASPPIQENPNSLADFNQDTVVDINDFQILRQSFGSCSGQGNFTPLPDLDGDNCVTFKDFRIFLQLFQALSSH